MKNLKIIVLTLLISTVTFGQRLKHSDLPVAVVENFKKAHPQSHVYQWKWKDKKDRFEAKFIGDNSKYKSYFSADGTWLRTKRDLKKTEVPQEVWKAYSNSGYADWKIDDIEEIRTPEYPKIYEIEVEKKHKNNFGKTIKEEVYLYFLPSGERLDMVKTN